MNTFSHLRGRVSSVRAAFQGLILKVQRHLQSVDAGSSSITTKPASPEFGVLPRKRYSRMDDVSLKAAILLFKEAIHRLPSHIGSEWTKNLPSPAIQPTFSGWGLVGNSGFKVNHRVSVYEHDDCMDFTSVLVTVDLHPVLILKVNQYRFTVLMVSEDESYFADIMNPCWLFRLESISDFNAMSEPIQRVVHEVLEKVSKRSAQKPSPTEVLLDYHSKPIAEGTERSGEHQHE